MTTAAETVDSFGGVRVVALLLDVDGEAIKLWIRKDEIPVHQQAWLQTMAIGKSEFIKATAATERRVDLTRAIKKLSACLSGLDKHIAKASAAA